VTKLQELSAPAIRPDVIHVKSRVFIESSISEARC
jgi:hypothetical protein